jgi:hypothetical protein
LGLLLFFWLSNCSTNTEEIRAENADIENTPGQRFEFSDFYHATEGSWQIMDPAIRLQSEKKFMSPSDYDRFTLHIVNSTDRIRIVESDARWKRVHVDTGKGVIEGWIDANATRETRRLD